MLSSDFILSVHKHVNSYMASTCQAGSVRQYADVFTWFPEVILVIALYRSIRLCSSKYLLLIFVVVFSVLPFLLMLNESDL